MHTMIYVALVVVSSFYLLCILRSILSIISIITNSYRKLWRKPIVHSNPHEPKILNILVIVPLYIEEEYDIKVTLESIAKQKYPKNSLLVAIVVEEEDKRTIDNVYRVLNYENLLLNRIKDRIIILKKPPPRTSKASAINYVIKNVEYGDVICILDGGDYLVDEYHMARAVSLINKGYDVVGSQVLRLGESIIGKLSYLDTLIWVKIGLPSIASILGIPLVSGEGLFIRRKTLQRIGYLPPNLLTEDAYLAIPSLHFNIKVAHLDSKVYESTPANILSLVKQRLRWYKGHLQCLLIALKQRGISLLGKAKLILAYCNPLIITSVLIAYIYALLTLVGVFPYTLLFPCSIIVILSTYTAPLYTLNIVPKRVRKITILLPFYWLFLSLVSTTALIYPLKIKWYKTLREHKSRVVNKL